MTTSFKSLHALLFKTEREFEENLQKLETIVEKIPSNSIITAPEVGLTGFCYDRFSEASEFSKEAKQRVKKLSDKKALTITLIEKEGENYYNNLYCFFDKQIVHKQAKHKLFLLGKEQQYFSKGSVEDIKIVDINGVRIGFLVCFELRFIELWERLKGAELIIIPAMWGAERREHFIKLSQGLATLLQCIVISCNSQNSEYQGGSVITTPNGDIFEKEEDMLSATLNLKEIKIFRRYLDVGIR